MARKIVKFDGLGDVVMSKRRGMRSVRLSVSHEGEVRLSLPNWTPYAVGENFIRQKMSWILDQKQLRNPQYIKDGDRIGKAHRVNILYLSTPKSRSRVNDTEIRVILPARTNPNSKTSQDIIKKAALRALKMESENLLIKRTVDLARASGFEYKSIGIKQLRSRWGSCTHQKDITLSCYLVQLPWHLIDYVIYHELMHTKVMAHGPAFWSELEKHVPNLKSCRAEIRKHRSLVTAQN